MESLAFYLIRVVLVTGLLTGYYVLVLRDRRMHSFNRFYLLSSVVVALLLPLLRIPWSPWATANGAPVQRVLVRMSQVSPGSNYVFWWRLALGICLLVSSVLLAGAIVKIRAVYRIKRVARVTPMDGYDLVETEAPGTPFSFLRNLFWRSGMDTEDMVNAKMLVHEVAHIRGRHSWDILGMQAVVCLFWMNPFFWYIRKELNMVLEFSADAAGADGEPELLARMLLQAYTSGRYHPTLSNGFFHSPIKRRLVMITNNNGSRRIWMRKALVMPVLATAVLIFACTKDATISKVPPPPPPQVADALDAQKLKLDSIQVKTLKFLPMKVRFLKGDAKKGEVKKWQDSVMVVFIKGNQIGVKD